MSVFSSSLALLLFATTGLSLEDADVIAPCHEGWLYSNGYCYSFFLKLLPWQEAQLKCQDYRENGNLVSILNEQEAAVMEGLIKAQKYYKSVWIGMFGRIETGWWIDDAETDYVAWAPEDPNYLDSSYYCVHLSLINGQWKWKGANCEIPQAYACKYEP